MTDPRFIAPLSNPFGLTNVGSNAAPVFIDLDDDGDLDAMVGDRNGNLQFYKNTGGLTNPVFAAPTENPFGLTKVFANATPTFVDIDDDGDLDAFVGDIFGDIRFYQNTGTASNPSFASPTANPFGLSDVGYFAAPTFADIDGDGDLDAFVGNSDGDILFYENTGGANSPFFASPTTNPFGLSKEGYLSTPIFADVDGDGDLDAFVGDQYGDIHFFRNEGTADSPSFAESTTNPFGLTNVTGTAAPTFADIDGDGDLDAIVGNSYGDIQVFRANRPPTAEDDTATVVEGKSVIISVLANDTDPDANDILSINSFTAPSNGSLVQNPNGTFTYTANLNFCGTTSFTYTIKDAAGEVSNTATVNITITPLNLEGGAGNDTLLGTACDNILNGNDGSDYIEGRDGNDSIDGGSGFNDRMFGGNGQDTIIDPDGILGAHGGEGNDTIAVNFAATWDNDNKSSTAPRSDGKITGGFGDDNITVTMNKGGFFLNMKGDEPTSNTPSDGNDTVTLLGTYGNAVVDLGGGNDIFNGGGGSDNISGGNGNDRLTSFGGNDQLAGQNGNDGFDFCLMRCKI
jgi:Ca2+-binding RTX toxin-like protein